MAAANKLRICDNETEHLMKYLCNMTGRKKSTAKLTDDEYQALLTAFLAKFGDARAGICTAARVNTLRLEVLADKNNNIPSVAEVGLAASRKAARARKTIGKEKKKDKDAEKRAAEEARIAVRQVLIEEQKEFCADPLLAERVYLDDEEIVCEQTYKKGRALLLKLSDQAGLCNDCLKSGQVLEIALNAFLDKCVLQDWAVKMARAREDHLRSGTGSQVVFGQGQVRDLHKKRRPRTEFMFANRTAAVDCRTKQARGLHKKLKSLNDVADQLVKLETEHQKKTPQQVRIVIAEEAAIEQANEAEIDDLMGKLTSALQKRKRSSSSIESSVAFAFHADPACGFATFKAGVSNSPSNTKFMDQMAALADAHFRTEPADQKKKISKHKMYSL